MIQNKGDDSDYVVHLVSNEGNPIDTIYSILSQQTLIANNFFGFRRDEYKQASVCFSEIPPKFLRKLVSRRCNHGIAFKKEWMIKQGAQRVWYVNQGCNVHTALKGLYQNPSPEVAEHLKAIAPFIDIPGDYGDSQYRFEWEREWRIVGNLSFDINDVVFIIMPEEFHGNARDFFEEAERENTGPNYLCGFYDAITDIASKLEL